MAPKKKKKPVANPARGFATTSLPSKPKILDSATPPAQAPEHADKQTDSGPANNDVSADSTKMLSYKVSRGKELGEMTADELEEYFEHERLHLLVEQNSVRVKADAARAVSKLMVERRQLRSNAEKLTVASWLNEELVDLVLAAQSTTASPPFRTDVAPHQADFDTDLILQLWTIERSLDALKLPKVGEALEHLVRLRQVCSFQKSGEYPSGLLELLEWYAFTGESNLLQNYDVAENRSIDGYESETDLDTEQLVGKSILDLPLLPAF